MREPVEALKCDAPDCEEEISESSSQLSARAQNLGWQVDAVTHVQNYGDTVSVSRTDRCPAHLVTALPSEEVAARTGAAR